MGAGPNETQAWSHISIRSEKMRKMHTSISHLTDYTCHDNRLMLDSICRFETLNHAVLASPAHHITPTLQYRVNPHDPLPVIPTNVHKRNSKSASTGYIVHKTHNCGQSHPSNPPVHPTCPSNLAFPVPPCRMYMLSTSTSTCSKSSASLPLPLHPAAV